jgi:hypothetical protein
MRVAEVHEIRPRASETHVCACGSQWFLIAKRFSKEGKSLETREEAVCESCGRKHHVITKIKEKP